MQRGLVKFLIVTSAVLCMPLLHPALGFAQGFSRLQVLLPGESPAPGSPSGKSGTPATQVVGVPFDVRVRACDAAWNLVTTVTDVVQLSSTDATSTLPGATALQAGTATLAVTINAAGTFTVSARDQTDNTIPLATTSSFAALLVHGFEFTRINQKNQYAGVPMPIAFHAVDPSGATVSGFSGQVYLQQLTSFGIGRIEPSLVTMQNGSWSGNVTLYRADETAINRGNVNIFAFVGGDPAVNGTSDPFTVHPGAFSRVQIVVPGQEPAPGSVSGTSGSPATQGAGEPFTVEVYGTDQYWNQVPSFDTVRIVSSDPAASTPVSGALNNGFRQFTLSLGTVGTQTLTVADQTNGSIQGMTSPGIPVIPNAVSRFVIDPVSGPVTAGQAVAVRIRATDASGNTIPNYNGDAILSANTGPQSIEPTATTFTNGVWAQSIVFKGAGGAVSFTCADFGAPPHTGTSNNFVVLPGPVAKLQVVPAGQTAQGGTPTGVSGLPARQQAGGSFTVQIRAVDTFWNRVPGVNDRIGLTSTDAFAAMPAETTLVNGERLLPVRLFKAGFQTITATDMTNSNITEHTSSAIEVVGGPYARIVILTSGQKLAPGTPTGQDPEFGLGQDINIPFDIRVLATDNWFNAVGSANDVIRITSTDPAAVAVVDSSEHALPWDIQLVDGQGTLSVRVSTGPFQKMIATNVTQPSMPPSETGFEVAAFGVELGGIVGEDASPDVFQATSKFKLTITAKNKKHAIRTDYNDIVTLRAVSALTGSPARTYLIPAQVKLESGFTELSVQYTFAEPIQIEIRDDDGFDNPADDQPRTGPLFAVTETVDIVPGPPDTLVLASQPPWVQGNKHATLSATVTDALGNGVPDRPVTFTLVSGPGTLSYVDSLDSRTTVVATFTDDSGTARADFHSGREPAVTRVRATSGTLPAADLDIQTAFVDPQAAGGYVTSYPNPFHPREAPATIAYKLADNAHVRLEVYTLSGGLVLRKEFPMGTPGGQAGLNEFVWDGRNGKGDVVASGGYLLVIEAEGVGETLHTMRRKIAVVH